MLHQPQDSTASSLSNLRQVIQLPNAKSAASNAATRISSNVLLMSCSVLVIVPDGSTANARVLLDSGSSVSFISERLAQALRLPRS